METLRCLRFPFYCNSTIFKGHRIDAAFWLQTFHITNIYCNTEWMPVDVKHLECLCLVSFQESYSPYLNMIMLDHFALTTQLTSRRCSCKKKWDSFFSKTNSISSIFDSIINTTSKYVFRISYWHILCQAGQIDTASKRITATVRMQDALCAILQRSKGSTIIAALFCYCTAPRLICAAPNSRIADSTDASAIKNGGAQINGM